MFKLKYPASASSPSLSTSAPTSPCRPSRSSSCALSVLQEQRQQQRHGPTPILTNRTRTTSLLSVSPRRPPPPFASSPKKQKIYTTAAQDTTLDEPLMSIMDTSQTMAASSSRASLLIAEQDEERAIASSSQNVVVCVRVRPAGDEANQEMWTMDEVKNRITPSEHHPTTTKRANGSSSPSKIPNRSKLASKDSIDKDEYDFQFDSLVIPSKSTNDMYESNISPIVDAVISGYNGTVFAYGQTGSGKTHTMSGTPDEKGVIPRAVEEVFERVAKESQREFLLRVSYLEIYNEMLKDLLAPYPSSSSCTDLSARPASPTKGGSSHVAGASSSDSTSLRILEAGGRIQIQGLREEIVTNAGEVLNLLEWGQRGRHQAATDWNERSSRSHCVFILTLESREQNKEGHNVRFSQLNLIDLAGSERAASEKERRKEGAFINKSLLTLGTVIAKLSDQCQTGKEDAHIPYRDSKLTRLLQTSLGGNARVAVVCTLSPLKEHAVESMSTLRFGQRCKMVVTKAKKGTIVNDKALIARYKKELERLRGQLEQGNSTVDISMSHDDASFRELQIKREEAEKDVKTMNDKRDELKKQVEHLTRLILTGKDVVAIGQEDRSDSFTIGRPRRAARRTDLGTSSPSKRQKIHDESRSFLAPLNDDQDSSMSTKPFALESELAVLRKNLAAAMMGRQASEEARIQETQLWKARIMELEAANTEQEEELDEAEVAFEKLKNDRDTLRLRVGEEAEANRLLQLVAKSRGVDLDESQKMLLEQSQRDVERLREELQEETKTQRQHEEQVKSLQQELASMQYTLNEQRGKDDTINSLKEELFALQASQGRSDSVLQEMATLRKDLEKALEDKDHYQKELTKITLERGQEDAERDFADLIKAGENTSTSEKALADKEEKLQERVKEVEALQRELSEVKQRVKPLPVPSVPASPSMPDSLRSVMERRLKIAEDRCKALDEENSSLKRGSKSKADEDKQTAHIANLEKQLSEAKRVMAPGSPLKAAPALQRGGSMREYKRYSLTADGLPANLEKDQAVKAEREEIERLNVVIQSQRSIMSDLEGSVAAWKSRLRLQNDIITRLVQAGAENIAPEDLSSSVSSMSTLKRTSSRASTLVASSSPYYGAHTYNRAPTGLGLGSTSPTKGVAWLATMPGVKPDPLPLNPNDLTASPSTRARRRPTIEHEIKELNGSPRVKSTTDRLMESNNRPLPQSASGTPAKLRRSRDYYI